jgi:hypothetical protein
MNVGNSKSWEEDGEFHTQFLALRVAFTKALRHDLHTS